MTDIDYVAIASIVQSDEEKIRADERRKFAEWVDKSYKYSFQRKNYQYLIVNIDEILSDYEKELKSEAEE